MVALAAWIAVLGVALPRAERHLPREIERWRERVEAGGETVRFYLATGDASYLSTRPGAPLPYPDASRLRAYLDGPEARAFLPPELLSRAAPQSAMEAAKHAFLHVAPAGTGFGAGMLLVALFWRWTTQDRMRPAANELALALGFKEARPATASAPSPPGSADRRGVLDPAGVPELVQAARDGERRLGAEIAVEHLAVVANALE